MFCGEKRGAWRESREPETHSARKQSRGWAIVFARRERRRLFPAFAQAFEVALVHVHHAFRTFLLDEFRRFLFIEWKCGHIPIFIEVPIGFHLNFFRRIVDRFRFGVGYPVAGGPSAVIVAVEIAAQVVISGAHVVKFRAPSRMCTSFSTLPEALRSCTTALVSAW